MFKIALISGGLLSFIMLGCRLTGGPEKKDPPKMKHSWVEMTKKERRIFGVNDKSSIERGNKLFLQHCKSCHGVSGRGDGKWAKDFGIKPANLRELSGMLPNHYLSLQINEGSGSMPRWKNLLKPQEIWDLTNYIQTLSDN